jgi:transposase
VKMSLMERVTLTTKELKRVQVVQGMQERRIKGAEAAQLLGLSLRQVWRLAKTYREKGAIGMIHGNRGRTSPRRISNTVRTRLLELARTVYQDYNDQHLTEKLAEDHGIELSRPTVRRIRRAAGLGSPRKRRAPRHRKRRERFPQAGMLLQMDGSNHRWLEGRGPRLTLIAAIDDATSRVVGALFREEEDTAGYMMVLEAISRSHGLPMAIYADRHTIFQSPKEPTIEEQLAGIFPRSQLGRMLHELDIQYIPAYSPQAKGRVERLFGTLQDRLVKTLREANASSLEEANQALKAFLPRFNRRFSRKAQQPGSAYRPWPPTLHRRDTFCFKYSRTVSNDNTISFGGCNLPIPPGPKRRSYARAQVQVRHHPNGQLSIFHQGQRLATFEPSDAAPLRVGRFEPAASRRGTSHMETVQSLRR